MIPKEKIREIEHVYLFPCPVYDAYWIEVKNEDNECMDIESFEFKSEAIDKAIEILKQMKGGENDGNENPGN
jgi:hypothetical protein